MGDDERRRNFYDEGLSYVMSFWNDIAGPDAVTHVYEGILVRAVSD